MKNNKITILAKIATFVGLELFMFFTISNFFPINIAFFSSTIAVVLFFLLTELNERLLFPYFYSSKKRFFLVNISVVILLAAIHFLIDGYFFRAYRLNKINIELPIYFPIVRSLSMFMLVNFISITVLLTNVLKRQAETEKKLREDKLGTEIKFLKAQINPHFIFNALNNIYSLSYTKSNRAPESILKLSDMLRYVYYDGGKDEVNLDAEIDYIENFISFHKMKSEHLQKINFTYDHHNNTFKIAPMLFIPFIENSFKYSKIEELKDAYINIEISFQKNELKFKIENSISPEIKANPGSGLGIQNVKKRLALLYPNQYALKIDDKEERFCVELKINKS